MQDNGDISDLSKISGNSTIKIIKSSFLSKRSKYLKMWKK